MQEMGDGIGVGGHGGRPVKFCLPLSLELDIILTVIAIELCKIFDTCDFVAFYDEEMTAIRCASLRPPHVSIATEIGLRTKPRQNSSASSTSTNIKWNVIIHQYKSFMCEICLSVSTFPHTKLWQRMAANKVVHLIDIIAESRTRARTHPPRWAQSMQQFSLASGISSLLYR